MKNKKILSIIPAQKNSRRLYNKNLQKINYKTLVEHAIEYAQESQYVVDVVITTNSEEIKKQGLGQIYRCHVMDRPDDLCGETDVVDVYRHVVLSLVQSSENNICHHVADSVLKFEHEYTHVVGIQPDNPDRQIPLDNILDYFDDKGYDDLITVDAHGVRNGSVRVMKFDKLVDNTINSLKIGTILDNCTNIHTKEDLNIARHRLSDKTFELSTGVSVGGNRTFIIAEGACNHLCSLNMAKRMIMDAKVAGADAIKFQTYKAETHVTKDAISYWGDKPIKQIDYYKILDRFGSKEYKELFDYAYEVGIVPFSTPFDMESAKLMMNLNMELFKIPSMAINDLELLSLVASFGKPIIMSTGGSNLDEIDRAINVILDQDNFNLALLACNLSYPTENKDANLARIKTLYDRYEDFIIGYSDHTYPDRHMVIPSLAVSMGAKIIEKHYAPDKTAIGS